MGMMSLLTCFFTFPVFQRTYGSTEGDEQPRFQNPHPLGYFPDIVGLLCCRGDAGGSSEINFLAINLCWILGQTRGVDVIRALAETDPEWVYRLPFAIQWASMAIILTGAVFAPKNPWWLIRQGRSDDPRKSVLLLTSKGAGTLGIEEIVAMMKHTNEVEKYYGNDKLTYLNCFQGMDCR
ncbi:hypothetical protein IFM58399_10431 [Aspergillus lentulus]|uniref:Uncharacterized protein n=1 Tax=Aspergillus lentulus TaxID=293939 RepID=A0ABQ1B7B2_ASPLE|nr:uncharacterized protein IFM58399_10431 [Aspergillus lentulus]KAF4151418.1 hypothetical protein CNMCM6069_003873 [Aspergillus lentulus]KAF4158097.1 hypothetical protein CNMCM6936_005283 [Aspergillus lentulus]KAF4176022.1 hypothetical protein CNMCM7927_004453 [Aspergillus lentulus]GFF56929.1 hypothetical protein IFM58399_10431 [Aspergillus lentulus]GFF81129.1 hypothetical protein IFM62136_10456 [Aspergillus lentulus]